MVHVIPLSKLSPEYKEILNHFETCFDGGKAPTVTKIERIQNPNLFRLYLAKKKSMDGRGKEMRLFHGTSKKNIDAINGNNFNRSYAGDTSGKCMVP